ncbi:hypothetical protein GobsT_12570 [Gemmata obscuriglobus]|uniref:hypothetical protein n=1 Tax=Gemmata obscuriglobus TaxID=114 RepID=UPI0011CD2DC0|nr:hypothetical protein [Gemmata obscuriglobus]QEG26517.1 hypothetical protein GobsT_12570 [Gemmata obscuriglobus]VTS01839.1 unnamed protein product [Gemmata obscuriglobus UQM 2246]
MRFIQTWIKTIGAAWPWAKRLPATMKFIGSICSCVGIGTLAAWSFWGREVSFATWHLAILLVVVIASFGGIFAAGLAVERMSRPLVSVGPFIFDVPYRTLSLRVTNCCKIPVKPKVIIREITCDNGGTIFASRVDPHWRTKPLGQDIVLPGGAPADTSLVWVVGAGQERPTGLYLTPLEGGDIPLHTGPPLTAGTMYAIYLIVTAETLTGEQGTPQNYKLSFVSDPSCKGGYRIHDMQLA